LIAAPQPEGLVIDANLFVQLVLEEPGSDSIDAFLFERHRTDRLLAPSILASETAAAITKKFRRRQISRQSAESAFQSLRQTLTEGTFELLPSNDFLGAAFGLSLKLHHPLHDCLYLAAARTLGVAFATRDKILATKALSAGIETELVAD